MSGNSCCAVAPSSRSGPTTPAVPLHPGKRRPPPGGAGFRRTGAALRTLLLLGFVALLGSAPAAAQEIRLVTAEFADRLEGDAGSSTTFVLGVELTATATGTGMVDYTFGGGSFTLGEDITGPASGTITFQPGEQRKELTYVLVGDDEYEGNESYVLALTNATGSISFPHPDRSRTQVGKIIEDDPPSLVIDSPTVNEGAAGSMTTLPFTVTLDTKGIEYGQEAEFKYRVAGDSTATPTPDAAADYVAVPGATLRKPLQSSTRFTWMIDVTVNGDDVPESNETVRIEIYDATVNLTPEAQALGAPSTHPVASATGTGTIVNDDAYPTFSINSPSVAEGASGTTATLRFRVTTPGPVLARLDLPWTTTAGGTATAGVDFEAATGTLTFEPGDLLKTFDVKVVGDDIYEDDEFVGVEFVPAGTTTAVAGRGTIANDEPLPRILFDSPSVTEGASGETSDLVFTMTMDRASDALVGVSFELTTELSTAASGTDFVAFGRQDFDFRPGELTKKFTVTVNGDGEVEANETVVLHVLEVTGKARLATSTLAAAPLGATLKAGTRLLATGTILDDEGPPRVSVQPQSVQEGASGETTDLTMRFTLDKAHGSDVSVEYRLATLSSTASATVLSVANAGNNDLRWGASGEWRTLTFAAGATEGESHTLTVIGDDRVEPDETVVFEIRESTIPAGIEAGTTTAALTILNDDVPALSFNAPSVLEGDSGIATLEFVVTLSERASEEVRVQWTTTTMGSAQNNDYLTGQSGTLVFSGNTTSRSIPITVNGDTNPEPDETVVLSLRNVTGPARIATPEGMGTIRNDDTTLTLVLLEAVTEDVSRIGANDGQFELVANPAVASGHEIDVEYRVVAGTGSKEATLADISFGSTGTFRIRSNEHSGRKATTTLGIVDDSIIEGHETLTIEIFNPRGATLSATSATMTIVDNDGGTFTFPGGTDLEYPEGRAGATTSVEVEVVLDQALPEDISIRVLGPNQDSGLTARYAEDFTLPEGIRRNPDLSTDEIDAIDGEAFVGTIPAGSTSTTVVVATIIGDDGPEDDERDRVHVGTGYRLSGIDRSFPTGGGSARPVNFRIRNDDHNLSVASSSVTEGDAGGTAELTFEVEVSNSPPEVTLEYEIYTASTTAGASDYGSASPSGGTIASPSRGTVTISEVSHSSDPGRASITVPVTGDVLVEADETVAIRLFNPMGEATSLFIPDSVIGIGTIRNDDYAEFSINSPSVTEGATGTTAALMFTVTLSDAQVNPASVDYAVVTGGTAREGVDYVALSPDTLTFAASETSKRVTVTVTGDERVEGDETVLVMLSNPTGGDLHPARIRTGAGTGTGTISDDDRYVFSISGGSVLEGGMGTATSLPFTVTLNQAATGTLTVQYEDTNRGTAASGTDYDAFSRGTLTFNAGETSKSFGVMVRGDDVPEDATKTVEVRLLNPSGGATLGTAVAMAEIRDDDIPVLSIDSPTVDEGDAGDTTVLAFTATLDRAAVGGVTFGYTVDTAAGGAADPSSDYGAITPASPVTIPMGSTSTTISVQVTADDVPEADETVTITIDSSTLSGVTLSPPGVGTGTIRNDDFPAIVAPGGTVDEGAATETRGLTLHLDAPLPGREVRVDWAVTGGSAASGTDYTGPASGTAVFAAGTTTATIGLTVQGNDVDEDDREIEVRLSNAMGADLPTADGTFTIRDDDDPPTISVVAFRPGNASTDEWREAELGVPLVFEIRLDAASGKTVTADFAFGGTAARGTDNNTDDYTIDGRANGLDRNMGAATGTVTFAPGETAKERYITVNGNDVPESAKTVVLELTNVRNAMPATVSRTLTIVDDDGVTVSARVVGQASRDEADGPITFEAVLSNPFHESAMVDWALGGMATNGVDYTATTTSGTFTFAPNETSKTLTLQVPDDTAIEPDRRVSLTLSNATSASGLVMLGSDRTATVTILNDDFPVLAVDAPREAEGNDLVFTVTKTPATAFATGTVAYAVTGGTAMAGTDYVALAAGTLTIPAASGTATITVEVTDDTLGEPDETVEITLSNPNALRFASGTSLVAAGTITDDDDLTLSIAGPAAPVNERDSGTTMLPFTLTLDAPSSRAVMVDWALTGDLDASDHGTLPASPLTIPAGSTSTTLNVPVTGDRTVERDETATVTLSNLDGDGVTVGFAGGAASVVANATVRNDDFARVSVAPAEVSEVDLGTSRLSFVLSLDRLSDLDVVIGHEVVAASGTATTGVDFDPPAAGTLPIPAGSTSTTLDVVVRGDTILEPHETVVVRFTVQQPPRPTPPASALASFAGGAASAAAIGTIRDNDSLTVSFVPPLTRVVDEGPAGASTTHMVMVQLNGESSATATVTVIQNTDGMASTRAEEGTDYATATKEVVFPPGIREVPFAVTVIGDGEDEPDETLDLELYNPSARVTASGDLFTLTIEDDDVPMLAVDSPRNVTEGASGTTAAIEFTVTMDRVAHQQVTVDYGVGGTATDNDFTSPPTRSGTLTFAVGEISKMLSFTVAGDGNAESNETVVITLSRPTGGAEIATGTGMATIVNDDDATLTIDSPRMNEGDTGTTDLTFTVTLTPSVASEVSVDWAVVQASSTDAGVTYPDATTPGGKSGTLVFPAGTTTPLKTETIRARVTADEGHGFDRVVVIELSGATGGAVVLMPRGTGTIEDDDAPEFAVAPVRVLEGASGTTAALAFGLTLDRAPREAVTVDWQVTGTPTTEADDWEGGTQPVGGTVTFARGETATSAVVGTVRGDDVGEDDETLTVRFSNLTGGAAFSGGAASVDATATIENDDFPEITVDSPSVLEGASGTTAALTLTVTLDPVSDREVTVDWDRSGGSATENDDYTFDTLPPGTLTFAPGASSTTIGVTVAGDGRAEPNETVGIVLGTLTGNARFPGGALTLQGTGTILNDDSITLSVTGPADVDEGGAGSTTALAFTVGLSSMASGTVGVRYEVGGTATDDDFSPRPRRSGTLTFAPGETSKPLTFTVRGDGTAEANETVTVTLSDLTGGGGGAVTVGASSTTVTIRNDDFPELTVATSSVAEGDVGDTTDLVFTLSLDGPDHEDVTVFYALGGTATGGGDDYGTPAPSSPITIPAGDRRATVTVPVMGDTDVEPDETVTLTLSNLTGGATRFPGGAATLEATGTIREDDIPLFSIDSPWVIEGASGTRSTMTFEVKLEPAATGTAEVDWEVLATDTTAAAGGVDYTATTTSGTLTFAPGGGPQTIAVTVHGDEEPEPNEVVVIELSNPTGGAEIGKGRGVGTIREDDLPLVSIDSPEVFEGNGGTTDLTFTVSMTMASSNPVTVDWRVTTASSTADRDDYRLGDSGRVTIRAGATTTTLTVPVTGDDRPEDDETVVIRIDTGNQRVILGDSEGVGTIVDDDIGLSIAGPTAPAPEGASSTVTDLAFAVSLAGTSTRDVTVEYAVTGGGEHPADSGDYGTPSPASPLVIPAGSDMVEILVPVTGDDAIENDETVTVTLSNPEGAGFGADGAEATATIQNDDVPDLDVSTSSSVAEGGRGERTPLPFTVSPRQPVPDGVTVTYRYLGDLGASQADGRDFAFATATFQIAHGAASTTVSVDVFGDFDVEPDETVAVRFLNPADDTVEVGRGTGTIRNDDVVRPDLAVAAVPASVPEGGVGGTSTLTFRLTLSATSSEAVTVTYRTLEPDGNGTARAGEDYRAPAPASPLVIAPGATSTDLVVEIVGDDGAELDETVALLFSVVDGSAVIPSGGIAVEATIENDDGLVLSIDSPSVEEGTGATTTLAFTVSLSGTPAASTTVGYTLGGTAAAGADYGALPAGPFVIPAGMASTSLRIAIVGDDVEEEDETVTVTLSSDDAGVMGGPGTGTILDDDGAKLKIDSPMVKEGATGATTTLTFTVTLSQPTSGLVTFRYRVVDEKSTAQPGTDYKGTFAPSGTITIPAGSTSTTIEVPVIDDGYGEPDEKLVIQISEATGARIRTDRNTGLGVILNDPADLAAVSVTEAEKEAGEAVFAVEVHPPVATSVLAFYRLEGGTVTGVRSFVRAIAGQDGPPGSDYVEIPAGGVGEVRALPDARTVTFTVTSAQGVTGRVYAVHPTENTATLRATGGGDPVARSRALRYVLAGIGRTIATNVVDLVWARAESHRAGLGGIHATVGGRRIDTGVFAADGDGALLRATVGLAGDLLGLDTNRDALLRDAERRLARGEGLGTLRDWTDLPDARDLAGRTDFAVSFANGPGGAPYTLWGRGNFTAFDSGGLDGGTFGDFSADGEVLAGHLGLDYRFREGLLAGIALSHTVGDVDYGFGGSGGRGGVKTELIGAHPYLHWMSPSGLGVWGTLGYGTGSAEIDEEGRTDVVETDLAMEMVAAGIRDELAYVGAVDIAVKADAFRAGISADEVAGGADLQKVDSSASRVRLALEASGRGVLANGGLFAGRFEFGARLDGGDAEEGAGADLAAGFDYAVPHLGLEVRGRGSLLLVHEESGFREWGLGLELAWDPGPAGRGLWFSIKPSWNAPSAGGAAAMWNAGPGGGGTAPARGASFDARLGYGMGVLDDRALATVFGEFGRVEGDARLRLGAGLGRPDAGGRGLGLELYGERRDRPGGPDHSLVLKGRLGF